MLKKIFSLVLLLITAGVFIISCSDDDSSTGPDDNGGNNANSPICQILEPTSNDSVAFNSAVQVKIKSKGIDSFVKETSIMLNGQVVQIFPAQVDESDTLRYFNWMTHDSVATNQFIAKSEDLDGNSSTSAVVLIFSADMNKKPVCEITSIPEHSYVESDSTLIVEVSASDVDGEISKVEFYVDGTLVNTVQSAPFLYQWSMSSYTSALEHSITAKAYDNKNATSSDEASVSILSSWLKFFGGSENDGASSIEQTTDGGYIVAGSTKSFGNGKRDLWVIKLSAAGEKVWDKTFGGNYNDAARSIQQTTDGGYIVAGSQGLYHYDGQEDDMWILKLSATGEKEWEKTFGGSQNDRATSIEQTTDGGYIVAGFTDTDLYDYEYGDMWVLKLSSAGEKEWDKKFGENRFDAAYSIQQTTEGGFIVAGSTESYQLYGYAHDMWILKLSAAGEKEWDKTYGGEFDDGASSIQQTTDGGYIVAGRAGTEVSGGANMWIQKLSVTGETVWDKTFGSGYEHISASSIWQTTDGGYVVAGGNGFNGSGMLIIKLSVTGEKVWDRTIGSKTDDRARSIQQTTDGGYVVAGYTESFGHSDGDMLIIKFFK